MNNALQGVVLNTLEGCGGGMVLLDRPDPAQFFASPECVEAVVKLITTEAWKFEASTTTEQGRKVLASQAYRVAQTKTYLDALGKQAVADLKDLPRQVDAGRKILRDALDALRDDIRKPLTIWEEKHKATQARRQGILDLPALLAQRNATASEIAAAWDTLAGQNSEWADDAIRDEVEQERQDVIVALAELHTRSATQEMERQELDRLRVERAEQERKDQEAQRIQAAADRAREEAEAKAKRESEAALGREAEAKRAEERARSAQEAAEKALADQRRGEDERRAQAEAQAILDERARREAEAAREEQERITRANDLEHRRTINRAALDALEAMEDKSPRGILLAIVRGSIPNVTINY